MNENEALLEEEQPTEPAAAEKEQKQRLADQSDVIVKEADIPFQNGSDEKLTSNAQSENVSVGRDFPEESTENLAQEPVKKSTAESVEETSSVKENHGCLTEKKPYHERYYLKYKDAPNITKLELNETRAFLQEIGFNGGELRQARHGKNYAENLRNAHKKENNQMYCSYCGSEIAGVEYYRLPDGRLRCTSCSNSVVKAKTEVEEICNRVIANMDNFFGATIDVPVAIEVLESRKLKKKLGLPLGQQDNQSMLILGVAVNKKQKYSILLENGSPRISLIATFAHELTHIWQYTHWDNKKGFKKCPKKKRLLIYEGMAKWAEIQYLYLVGETTVARREEEITRNRNDEYGIGFCLYEDQYPLSRKAMSCEDTPFTPNGYPFD